MALEVEIKKRVSDFNLEVSFVTNEKSMGILGASGCGKSMTLKCIAGIEKPDEGRIVLDATVLFDSKKKINVPPQKRNVGYLFQNYALFPTMTVEDNIGVGIKGKKENKNQIMKEQIQRFRLEGLEKRYPGQLSGGQQQRVALARIMAYSPKIIMFDEPFSALDSFLKDILHQELLETLKEFPGEIIMVSHSRDEIFKFCDKLVIMTHGRVSVKGNTKEIFKNPKKLDAARITGCKNISRIRRISNYELEALDWEIILKTEKEIKDSVTHVGIRARHLQTANEIKTDINTMRVEFVQAAETPFDIQYIVRNAYNSHVQDIWWIKSRNQLDSKSWDNIPDYLLFPGEQLMLLEN